jgi:MSHA biogenesis protein MshP
MKPAINNQRGFSAIIVIVLIVLFALIGGYMATLSSVSAISTAVSGASMQAWFAARSGAEWGVHQALNTGNCTGTLTVSGYNVVVACPAPAVVTENPDTYNVYTINVTASRGIPGQESFVSRSISVKVTDAP